MTQEVLMTEVRVPLPTGGWQIGFGVQPVGRSVVEVTDADGARAGRVTSSATPIVSIDGGWAGCVYGPGLLERWWVLAIGRAPTDASQTTVTFTRTRRGPTAQHPESVDGLWVLYDGLWVAATTGRYTHVRLTAGSETRSQRLRLVASPPKGNQINSGWCD